MHSQYNDKEGQLSDDLLVPVRRPQPSDGEDRDDPSAKDNSLSRAASGA